MDSLRQNIKVRSPAKLNLTFDITGLLSGGYHEVETLMQAISLEDELEFDFDFSSDRFIIEISEIESDSHQASVPKDAHNLISKAAYLFYEHSGTNAKCKVSCKLKKHIPVAGGMGGGSGNAAATLVALNIALQTRMPEEQLSRMASQLGADVPFFLSGGIQIGKNKGEVLSPVSHAPAFWFVIISARGLSLATPQIYADYDACLGKTAAGLVRPDLPRALETLQLAAERLETPAITFDRGFANVFTAIVLQKYPLLKELAEEIAALTTRAVHMTGSGPTLFICAETEACAGQLADLITAKINQPCREQNSEKLKVSVWTASSVTHGAKVSSSTLAEA